MAGCIKEDTYPQQIQGQATSGIPVLFADFSIADMVNKSNTKYYIRYNDEGYYSVYLGPDTFEFPIAENLIKIPSQNLGNKLPSSIPMPPSSPTTINIFSYKIPFQVSDPNSTFLSKSHLNKIDFKKGQMDITMSSTDPRNLVMLLSIPNLINRKNNTSLIVPYSLSKNGSPTVSTILDDYSLFFTDTNSIVLIVSIIGLSGSVTANPGNISFKSISLNNVSWKKITGDVGTINFPIVNNQNQKVFSGIEFTPSNIINNGDVISIELAKMLLTVTSSFGIPLSTNVDYLRAKKSDGKIIKTYYSSTDNLPYIDFSPGAIQNPDGKPIPRTKIQTISTNLIKDLLSQAPNLLEYTLNLQTNSSKNSSKTSSTDFITDSSKIKTISTLELPLWGYVNQMQMNSENEIQHIESIENYTFAGGSASVNEIQFQINYENSMPFGFNMDAILVDDKGTPVRNLFGKLIKMPPANVNSSDNKVNDVKTGSLLSLKFDKNDIKDIRNLAKKLKMNITISTTDAPFTSIKLTDYNRLKLRISILGNASSTLTFTKK
ncbi:MAG: hypothetical protein SFY32_13415 [Bacteroidota bacterium]|nr:hypothetical protein [Bacteroidota bacterium]